MAMRSLALAVRHLSKVAGRQAGEGLSDFVLLERVVSRREEAAFELLMWRHERMVRGVCWRVLGNQQDVEDACQATFLTLACKASGISRRQSLGGWLYKVAFRIALRAKADAQRRGRHEKRAGVERLGLETGADEARPEIRSIVAEEVSRLPEKYRTPVVLCYLEGKTNEEAASQLGCPTGTVVTWLARARERLRTRLGRRGLGVSAGALATLLSTRDLGTAAPPAFLEATLKNALLLTHDKILAGPVSARVALLTKGALHAMMMDKLKMAAAIVVSLCLAGAGSGVLAYRSMANDEVRSLESDTPHHPADRVTQSAKVFTTPLELEDPLAEEDPPAPEKGKEKAKEKKDGREKAEEVLTESFKTGKAPAVFVELFNGGIEIVADAENAVKARVVKQGQDATKELAQEALKNIEVKMTQEKDTIRIKARRLENKSGPAQESASAEIHVPAAAVLDLKTTNGSVTLTGGNGKDTVHTTNGSIKAKDSKGSLHLTTTNGAIEASGATGQLELEATNGRITIQAEKARVKATGANGAIHFSGTLAEGASSLSTVNGRILVTLPGDAQFKVDARTTNGKIASDFSAPPARRPGPQHLEATVGEKPAATLKLQTNNGGIEIHKQK